MTTTNTPQHKGPLSPYEIIQKYERLKTNRGIWEEHWTEVLFYTQPQKAGINISNQTPGDKRGVYLFDNTAMQSAELLAGALHGLLTNPYGVWLELTTGDEDLDSNDEVRMWLQDSSKKIVATLNASNFQTEIHEVYLDLVSVGTAPISIEDDDEKDVIFGARNIKEMFIMENNKGVIDELIRHYKWSAKKIVQEYGEAACSKMVMDAFKKEPEKEFTMLHYVFPRPKGYSKIRLDWVHQIVCEDDKYEYKVGGYDYFPFAVPRWSKLSDEVYGRSPGMKALPEAKTVNKMTEDILIAAEKAIDPPLQAPDEGFIMPLKTFPGGVSYYRKGMQDRIEPVFEREIRLDFGNEAMTQHRQRIREAFYVDQLQLGQGPQMTATEVNQRTEEKLRFLGPVVGRQQPELLAPIVDVTFAIMMKKKKFKPIPQILAGKNITPRYASAIAKVQRINESQKVLRAIEAMTPFYNADKTVLDNIDGDEAVKEIANMYGLPQNMIRTKDAVAKIRDARAKAQQAMLKQQQEAHQADVANKVVPGMAQMQQAQQQGQQMNPGNGGA